MSAQILLVEDNDLSREEWAITLRREGFQVISARHGQEALDYLKAGQPPDLILLDMLLPVLDGWHFLRKVSPSTVPIIIATGTILTLEWATSHGCAGFLRKPISTDDLLAEVHRCLATGA
jgi:CheY-like chemotaxis protein